MSVIRLPEAPQLGPPPPESRLVRGARFALGVVLSVFLPTRALTRVVEPRE